MREGKKREEKREKASEESRRAETRRGWEGMEGVAMGRKGMSSFVLTCPTDEANIDKFFIPLSGSQTIVNISSRHSV